TLGPTIGGYLIDDYSWPYIFYVNIPVGIAATVLTLMYIKNPPYMTGNRTPASQVDWLGIGLLIAGVGSLQLVLEQGEREDWFSSPFITTFALVAAIGVVGFIWRELTAKLPIVDLRVLKNRNLAVGTLFSFILGFGLFASVFIVPVFVQSILGFTALQTGLMLIPGAIATGFMMPIVGTMIQKGISQKYMIAVGFVIFFLFTYWVYTIITPQAGQSDFFYPLLLRGVGLGLLFVPVTTFSLSTLRGKEIAAGAGLTAMVRQLGGSFGVAIVSSFIASKAFIHRSDLLRNISIYDLSVQDRLKSLQQGFMQNSGDAVKSQDQAYKALDLMITKQSYILTYMDTFLILGIFFLLCIPLVFLIRKSAAGNKVDLSAVH
ncbi:MAG: DHA2 family efflux MFS transporter permease subunit, partial [Daejeonella sp.]